MSIYGTVRHKLVLYMLHCITNADVSPKDLYHAEIPLVFTIIFIVCLNASKCSQERSCAVHMHTRFESSLYG